MIATATPVDLCARADDEQIVRLIAMGLNAEAPETEIEHARRAGREYRDMENMDLWGVEEAGRVHALIGVQIASAGELILRDLAVAPEARRQGIGRRLIDFVRRELAPDLIRGYTWWGAVAFYEHCGFAVREDGVLASGGPRCAFEWRRS